MEMRISRISLSPIETVKNIRLSVEEDNWGDIVSIIELHSTISEDALFQIEDFSHAVILYYFYLVEDSKIEMGARHPRNN